MTISYEWRGAFGNDGVIALATERARAAGCEWLHVDFDADLGPFYVDPCGFRPAAAGLIALQE